MSFEKDLEMFKARLGVAFGNTIRKPLPARLGTVLSSGEKVIRVPNVYTDEPNMFYFHEAGGQSFQGQAQLTTEIPEDKLVYGVPIRIQKDILTGTWEITGLDTRLASQYFKDVPRQNIAFYGYENLAIGLLTETTPQSSRALVTGASYNIGDEWKYISAQETIDWSVSPYSSERPASNKQRFVMVAMDFDNEILVYKYGSEIDITVTYNQALITDNSNGNHDILPIPDNIRQFRVGYIRLLSSKATLERFVDIFPLQDYLSKIDNSTPNTDWSKLVTANGEVVVSNDGDVVTIT